MWSEYSRQQPAAVKSGEVQHTPLQPCREEAAAAECVSSRACGMRAQGGCSARTRTWLVGGSQPYKSANPCKNTFKRDCALGLWKEARNATWRLRMRMASLTNRLGKPSAKRLRLQRGQHSSGGIQWGAGLAGRWGKPAASRLWLLVGHWHNWKKDMLDVHCPRQRQQLRVAAPAAPWPCCGSASVLGSTGAARAVHLHKGFAAARPDTEMKSA